MKTGRFEGGWIVERPGSELFVVYTDERDTSTLAQTTIVRGLKNRAFVVKINRLLRF